MNAPQAVSIDWGLCSFGYDPDTLAVIGKDWARHTRAFPCKTVRCAVITGKDGSMPTNLLRQSIDAYAAEGVSYQAELPAAFRPQSIPTGWHQNMPLNTTGDTFNSPYIDALTLRAAGVMRQAVKSGLKLVIWGNEPNELLVAPGDLIPQGGKGGSLAPTVAAATYWQGASRMHALGVEEVYCGALSILPRITGLNSQNPYYALWVTKFYEACHAHGRHAPYPWAGWAVNVEGVWTTGELNQALSVLRGIMAKFGDTGSIRIGEWGWEASPGVNAANVDLTISGIKDTEVLSAMFFQGPGKTPYLGAPALYKGAGAYQWRQDGKVMIPEADYIWGTILRPRYAQLVA